jgi:cell shape-determining protein MreC
MEIGNLISQLSDRLKYLESENTKLRKQLGDH